MREESCQVVSRAEGVAVASRRTFAVQFASKLQGYFEFSLSDSNFHNLGHALPIACCKGNSDCGAATALDSVLLFACCKKDMWCSALDSNFGRMPAGLNIADINDDQIVRAFRSCAEFSGGAVYLNPKTPRSSARDPQLRAMTVGGSFFLILRDLRVSGQKSASVN